MSNFEQQIKNALRHDPIDQPGLIEMAASTLHGRQRFFNIITALAGLGFLAGMAWCAVSFFKTSDVREMILWATLFLFMTGGIMMMKLWFWLMMIRYSIARELKRVELQFSINAGTQR